MDEPSMVGQWLAASARPDSSGATDDQLDAAEAVLGIEFPDDYRAMMRQVDGGEADFGESWVRIYSVERLVEANTYFRAHGFPPEYIFFGSDGGGDAYAWDWHPRRRALYIVIPFIVPDRDAAIPCGNSLEEFFATLHRGAPFAHGGAKS